MSKEMTAKEALRILKANAILFDDGTDFGASMLEAISDLDKALTPPSADEVCEALSEYYGIEVIHDFNPHEDINETFMRDIFYFGKIKHDMNGKEYMQKKVIVIGGGDGVSFNSYLPPHLITLIGRFYEGVGEE